MQYNTVFDITGAGYKSWNFPAFGLIFVAIGATLVALVLWRKALPFPRWSTRPTDVPPQLSKGTIYSLTPGLEERVKGSRRRAPTPEGRIESPAPPPRGDLINGKPAPLNHHLRARPVRHHPMCE